MIKNSVPRILLLLHHIHKAMNWGWKIFILYIGFAAMILTLVVMSTQEKIELVTSDYYKKEIAFQGILEASKNAQDEQALSTLEIQQQNVKIHFPDRSKGAEKSIFVYSVSESSKDQHLQTSTESLYIPLSIGKYKLQMSWSLGDKKYFEEKIVQIK